MSRRSRTIYCLIHHAQGDSLYKLALEDVPERNPRKEPLKRLKGAVQERRPLAAIEYILTQLVDLGELL